jgi:hypothetical protein
MASLSEEAFRRYDRHWTRSSTGAPASHPHRRPGHSCRHPTPPKAFPTRVVAHYVLFKQRRL